MSYPDVVPALERPDLVAAPVARVLAQLPSALVFEIDPELADTEALCSAYELPADEMANCVVINGKRGELVKTVACLALASTRVDVNTVVRKRLDVRKASFAPMDFAVENSGMEYGGITPVGLPGDWPVWIDSAVLARTQVCVGSGVRRSKLLVDPRELLELDGVVEVTGLAR